jgi:hypothetical protein
MPRGHDPVSHLVRDSIAKGEAQTRRWTVFYPETGSLKFRLADGRSRWNRPSETAFRATLQLRPACWRRSGRLIIGADWPHRHIFNEIDRPSSMQGGLASAVGNANDSVDRVRGCIVFDT